MSRTTGAGTCQVMRTRTSSSTGSGLATSGAPSGSEPVRPPRARLGIASSTSGEADQLPSELHLLHVPASRSPGLGLRVTVVGPPLAPLVRRGRQTVDQFRDLGEGKLFPQQHGL